MKAASRDDQALGACRDYRKNEFNVFLLCTVCHATNYVVQIVHHILYPQTKGTLKTIHKYFPQNVCNHL